MKLLKAGFFARLIFSLLLLISLLAGAQLPDLNLNPISYKLRNGLQVIIVEDSSLPLVSVVLAYGTGSIHDPENKEGLAYLMQNLMFQGSENVGPLQHINYIQNVGGELNAATTFDKTFFYQTVPSNQLGLVLWLESDRMHFLEITQQKLEREKENIIRNENQRILQEPFSRYFFLIDQIMYPDFSYGHPLIGSANSIRNISLEDVVNFYRKYYVPNNAVLCISGDIKTQKARELVSRYFESIPRGSEAIVFPSTALHQVFSSRDQTVIDPLVSTPGLQFGIRLENFQPGDQQLLRMLEQILIAGKTSRLANRLLRKERVALYFSGGLEERRDFLSLKIFLLANNQAMVDRCKKIMLDEFNRLKTEMITDRELERARNNYKFNYLNQLTGSNLSRAMALADSYLKDGKLPAINDHLSFLEKVTSYSILSLARRHLLEEKYCFITILPR